MFQAYFGMIIGAVSSTLAVLPQLTAGAEPIRSLGEVLECRDIEDNEGKAEVKSIKGKLDFERGTHISRRQIASNSQLKPIDIGRRKDRARRYIGIWKIDDSQPCDRFSTPILGINSS